MNSIDYFSPDELAQLRQTATRGVGAATDQGQSISSAYAQKKAALAAQRLGTGASSTPPAASASAPIEAPAPAALAADTAPSLGQRILNAKNTAVKYGGYLLRGLGGVQAAQGIQQAATEAPSGNSLLGIPLPSSGAVDTIANGLATAASPGIGFAGDIASKARDLVLGRILGYHGEGNDIQGPELKKQVGQAGGLDKLLAQQQAARTNPQPEAAAPQVLTQIPAGVPENGTGYIQNNTTGKVTPVGSPSNVNYVRRQVPVEVGGSTPPSLQPSQGGGIFESLIGPTLARAQQHAFGAGPGTASEAQAYKRQQAQQAQNIESAYKTGELGVQNRVAGAHETSAQAQLLSAGAKENPVKVVQKPTGEPIIVNTATHTAFAPTVATKPTLEDFMTKAREASRAAGKNPTDEQLKAHYQQNYGG